jgi:hypothetical protein
MSRISAPALGLVISLLASTATAYAESATIRIEPRPYHGAVVTIEQGVRVWRPLPPSRYVIINPNQTPLSLGLTDIREQSTSHNYFYGAGGGGDVTVNGGAGWPIIGGRDRHGHHKGHHKGGSGFNGHVKPKP